MEGELSSKENSEETTECCLHMVKQELIEDEDSTATWSYVEPKIKEEIKTEFMEVSEDTVLPASRSEANIEFIEIKVEPKELEWSECQPESREPSLEGVSMGLELPKGPSISIGVYEPESFKCNECGQLFNYKRNLIKHILSVHEKVRPHRCPHCEYAASEKSHLSNHVKAVHEKLKQYQCPQCPYACSVKHKMTRHIMSVHEKVKPHRCPYCEHVCSRRGNLTSHIKSVHEKLKPFKCPHCEYACSERSNLSKHVKFVHDSKQNNSISLAIEEVLQNYRVSTPQVDKI